MKQSISTDSPPAPSTAAVARQAVQRELAAEVGDAVRIGSGRSCEAFVVADYSGTHEWVVRVPVPGTDRSIRFHAEATLGNMLVAGGHPVASWTVVEVDGIACVVGERLPGRPITNDGVWSAEFGAQLGDLLSDLHALDATGYGPLVDAAGPLHGEASCALDGVRRRWRWATCWPFDGSALSDHPVSRLMPQVALAIAALEAQLIEAAEGPVGVVHSDLHHEHLLVGHDGGLAGVLDFGDAFVGAIAWDFALLHWYYGPEVSQSVAQRHPGGRAINESGRLLAAAVGIYKLAKSPNNPEVPARLSRLLGPFGGS